MIHREGFKTLTGILAILVISDVILWLALPHSIGVWLALIVSAFIIGFVSWFFRKPRRPDPIEDPYVIAPADGTIIAVDELFVGEFFKDYRTRVSIFMSGGNVHVNWIPLTGFIRYQKYNPGKHLFARHEKSSDQNERSTVVIESPNGDQLMVRQIAGIMARRVITYPRPGLRVQTGGELGFIKFGSRVDLFFPKGTKILVREGDKTAGRITRIAEWNA
jgi:phosphatidylserine decarboxylase